MTVADLRRRAGRLRGTPPGVVATDVAWRATRAAIRARGRPPSSPRRPAPSGAALSPFLFSGRPVPAPSQLTTGSREACGKEAEAALSGRFEILGFGTLDFGRPVRWHVDPVSGREWPLVAHARLAPSPGVSDIKVPWEASRLHWLVALARAGRSTADPRFVEGAGQLVEEWREGNPVGWGVNWVNAMEVGIRAVNLVWAAEIAGDPRFARLVAGLLPSHGRHILENLEYSPRLTSNHYLADLVGLLYIGGALRRSRSGRAWLRFAAWACQREVLKQFRPDGVNFEASTGYHRLSTELVLLALVAMGRLGLPVRPEVVERFDRSLDVLAAVAKPDGLLPAIGDDDSGTVVNLSSGRDPRDPWPIVEAGRALLGRGTDRTAPAGELALWAVGGGSRCARPRTSRTFPDSGVHVLQDQTLWCLIDGGSVGQRGNGGHAHNDALSFVLAVRGHEVVTDPGTFSYTGDPVARNAFRSTRAHSTVEVDGEEINRFAGDLLFTLREGDHPVTELVDLSPSRQRVVARHSGYSRLADPVVHRRSWELSAHGLVVGDELHCAGRHRAVVSFPLVAGAAVDVDGGRAVIRVDGVAVDLLQVAGAPIRLGVETGAVSPRYGSRQPAPVVRGTVDVAGPTAWAFRLALREDER